MIVISTAPRAPQLPVNPYRSASMLVPSSAVDIENAMPQTSPDVVFAPRSLGYVNYSGMGAIDDSSKKKLLMVGIGTLVGAGVLGYFLFRK